MVKPRLIDAQKSRMQALRAELAGGVPGAVLPATVPPPAAAPVAPAVLPVVVNEVSTGPGAAESVVRTSVVLPASVWRALRRMTEERRAAGEKRVDVSALVRKAIKEYYHLC